jgi:hypothetical protein
VEGGVEDRDVRDVGQRLARAADLLERGPVVERRERRELLDRLLHLVVDESRTDEAPPTVHDAMADGVGRDEVLQPAGFVPGDEVKLEARGAGVDHQDVDGRRVP